MSRVLLPLIVCGVVLAAGVWWYGTRHAADAAIENDNEIRKTIARLEQRLDGLGGGHEGLNRDIAAALIQWSNTVRTQGERAEAFREAVVTRLSTLEAGIGLPPPARLSATGASPPSGQPADARLDALETQIEQLRQSVRTALDISAKLHERLGGFKAELDQLDRLGRSAQSATDITAGLNDHLGALETELQRMAAGASDTVIVPADFGQSIDTRLNTLETRIGELADTQLAANGSATDVNAGLISLDSRLDRLEAHMVTSADISMLLEHNAETIRQALLSSTVAAAALPDPADLPDQLVVPSESN